MTPTQSLAFLSFVKDREIVLEDIMNAEIMTNIITNKLTKEKMSFRTRLCLVSVAIIDNGPSLNCG